MIEVNKTKMKWHEGMTIASLVDTMKDNNDLIEHEGTHLYIFVNDEILGLTRYEEVIINDRDVINILPMIAAG